MKKHPGIRIDKIPVKESAGLLFAAAVVLIVILGVPQLRLLARLRGLAGLAAGPLLYWLRHLR